MKPVSYEKGGAIVKPDDVMQSLFIVRQWRPFGDAVDEDREDDQLRFGPGDHFGLSRTAVDTVVAA